jgi:large subunit ribosomal protein L9
VRQVGFKDDVLNVKNGYANNFLLPKGLAVVANESNMKMLAENTKQATYKQEKVKKDALGMSESLNDLNVTLGAKAGANGKIFGSITPLQLAQALKLKGYEVDRPQDRFRSGYQECRFLHRYTQPPQGSFSKGERGSSG